MKSIKFTTLAVLIVGLFPQMAFACGGHGSPFVWDVAFFCLVVAVLEFFVLIRSVKNREAAIEKYNAVWLIPFQLILSLGMFYVYLLDISAMCMSTPREDFLAKLDFYLAIISFFLTILIINFWRMMKKSPQSKSGKTLAITMSVIYGLLTLLATVINIFIIPSIPDAIIVSAPPVFIVPTYFTQPSTQEIPAVSSTSTQQ